MVIYFDKCKAYEYKTDKPQADVFIDGCIDAVYTGKRDMDIKYGIESLFMAKRTAVSVVLPIKDSFINYGNDADFDKKYCEANDIQCRYQDRKGGSVIAFSGDIYIYDLRPNKEHDPIVFKFIQDIMEYLNNRTGKETVFDGNDVLLDGHKVLGMAFQFYSTEYGDYSYMGGITSINADTEVIEKVCYKKSGKIPGSLADYGITTKEVAEWILDWFDSHKYEDK